MQRSVLMALEQAQARQVGGGVITVVKKVGMGLALQQARGPPGNLQLGNRGDRKSAAARLRI